MSVDYIATAKRDYEGELTHLKVRAIESDEAMAAEARSKDDVVQDIQVDNKTYYTARRDDEEYVLEKKLRVLSHSGDSYIRTDDRDSPEDSLADLPKF